MKGVDEMSLERKLVDFEMEVKTILEKMEAIEDKFEEIEERLNELDEKVNALA